MQGQGWGLQGDHTVLAPASQRSQGVGVPAQHRAQPQGLCTCCSLCLAHCFPRQLRGSLLPLLPSSDEGTEDLGDPCPRWVCPKFPCWPSPRGSCPSLTLKGSAGLGTQEGHSPDLACRVYSETYAGLLCTLSLTSNSLRMYMCGVPSDCQAPA